MFRTFLVHGNRRCQFPLRKIQQGFFSSQKQQQPQNSNNSAAEIAALRREIQTLQDLIRQQSNRQTRNVERLEQQVESRSSKMEQSIDKLHQEVVKTSALERVSSAAREYVEHNDTLKNMLDQVNKQAREHPRFINKYVLVGLLFALFLLWRYRASIQQRTSKEVADIASRTLEQETLRQSIRETLDALASSPETLQTLTELLQALIQEPATQQQLVSLIVYAVGTEQVQNALLELLQNVFQDAHLQELSGVFLLKGLDVEHVKKMLQDQTQDLVRVTVSDESVQRATGKGIKRSLWYAIKPPFV